ncbi:MAG: nucleotidyltransferase, partial [Rubrivivax sp.]|nr:nucleotidyltransferase [Rubrivivax sp.]
MSKENKLSKRVIAALAARRDEAQWEKLIVGLLHKLELPREKRLKAIEKYEKLGHHIARKLGVGEADVHMLAQGSMAT